MKWVGISMLLLAASTAGAQVGDQALALPELTIDWVKSQEGGAVPEGGGIFVGVSFDSGGLTAEIGGEALEVISVSSLLDDIEVSPPVFFVRVPGAVGETATVDLMLSDAPETLTAHEVVIVAADEEAPAVALEAEDLEISYADEEAPAYAECINVYSASVESSGIEAEDHTLLILDDGVSGWSPALRAGEAGRFEQWGETTAAEHCAKVVSIDMGLNIGESETVCAAIEPPESACGSLPRVPGCSSTETGTGSVLWGVMAVLGLGALVRRRRA